MKKISEIDAKEAREHFLKGSSYFNGDFPSYISFEPMLKIVSDVLAGSQYSAHKSENPDQISGVNYSLVANKDGRFAWRPLELMHPVLYVSLINLMCSDENWPIIIKRLADFDKNRVICCSLPVISVDHQKDQAAQIKNWWQTVEQQSLKYSLEFSHILHTDVTDCYGALYTHGISWAIHGMEASKAAKGKGGLLGDKIDVAIRAGRYGQTNGISQGSVLMDFIAELVLGYVDELISVELGESTDFRILRYRDDYRIFSNSDVGAEKILKVISDKLRIVGMRLGAAKTFINTNVVEGSIKPDKLAGIDLQDLGTTNAQTLQKQLLRLHTFGRRYPNSGSLRKLIGELHTKVIEQKTHPDDLEVQIAIATDIAVVSPSTFPAIAGILSHLISLARPESKGELWDKVSRKMSLVPNNGYLEIWLQRVTKPKAINIEHQSSETLCRIVNGEKLQLWDNSWISNKKLLEVLDTSGIVIKDASETPEVMASEEVELFKKNAWQY
ncbi:RNA-directed DNA polymerase [Xanthomonas cucurbitae]|uniref:RNA-directed DNA polymerase n=1 Tax=Xanthomonas cucurbitae TaxID=56453 RepID=A0ABY7YHK7_9XANT|nr:RNA-directed DNA polymerase [Xanthomonas cucurbitae]WDM69507.1 RNA-directed DNA polymerase [Xanthomonas cucurbitae]WDM73382.1 RNA-directed DNA polymerase [Xanthomonas cucurbitae]